MVAGAGLALLIHADTLGSVVALQQPKDLLYGAPGPGNRAPVPLGGGAIPGVEERSEVVVAAHRGIVS